ncbi:YcxB family protein [Fusobacterium necrophorum]|uniref:YcxB family protein n=1 Tax=Fusobacterium necrophorum TaxID=859 RepID=UPI0007894240|nr:YcxB family protein [Fusobacterium necrophorum]KYM45067.1 hypothetical protein A2U15_05735 [Fusobacterium necrophorum subsp. funduliforme]
MEYQYESRFLTTNEMIKEYIRKVLKSFFRKCLFGIFLSFTLLMLIAPIPKRSIYLVVIVGVLCILFDIFYGILLFREINKIAFKLHNEEKQECIVQFGENISMKEGNFSLGIEYSQINKIYYLKHSFVLMFTRHNGIIVSPTHFTKGDFEHFQEFIQEKCPKAKRIIKN